MSRYYIVVRQLTLMALRKAGYTPTHDLDQVFTNCLDKVCLWFSLTGVKTEFLRDPSTLDYARFEELCRFVSSYYRLTVRNKPRRSLPQ